MFIGGAELKEGGTEIGGAIELIGGCAGGA